MLALAANAGDEVTGYDLKAWADSSLSYFWSSAKSQIYAVLARLDDRGLIRARHMAQTRRPDKNLYTITAAGRRALDAWMNQPLRPLPPRNLLLLRIFFGALSSKEAVIADIEAYVERAQALRQELLEIDDESRSAGRMNVYYSITREYGIALCDMIETWATHAIRDVRRADNDGRISAALPRARPRRRSQQAKDA
jgi:PadR family transcriptional regulator, regulatory protein AphA